MSHMVWRGEREPLAREGDREVLFKEMIVQPTPKGQEEIQMYTKSRKKLSHRSYQQLPSS